MLKNINISWISQMIIVLLVIANLSITAMENTIYGNVIEITDIETCTDTGEKKEKETKFLINYQAIVPVSQLPVFIPFTFSFELTLIEESEENIHFEAPVFINNYFFTLFRQIISPNAP